MNSIKCEEEIAELRLKALSGVKNAVICSNTECDACFAIVSGKTNRLSY